MIGYKAGQIVGGVLILCVLMCRTNEWSVLTWTLCWVAWPVVGVFFISMFGGVQRLPEQHCLAIAAVSLVGLLALARIHGEAHRWYQLHQPPPRPMFHNVFGDDARRVLPGWYQSSGVDDRFGHWMWSDHEDNTLLIVATGISKLSESEPLFMGVEESSVRLSHDRSVTLTRSPNRVVIVLPDGQVQYFRLDSGLARQFDGMVRPRPRNSYNLLREVRSLVTDSQAFDEFLRGYSEPISAW